MGSIEPDIAYLRYEARLLEDKLDDPSHKYNAAFLAHLNDLIFRVKYTIGQFRNYIAEIDLDSATQIVSATHKDLRYLFLHVCSTYEDLLEEFEGFPELDRLIAIFDDVELAPIEMEMQKETNDPQTLQKITTDLQIALKRLESLRITCKQNT